VPPMSVEAERAFSAAGLLESYAPNCTRGWTITL